MSREFNVLLLGASGFTGRLVAEYLNRTCGDLSWAIAVRNPAGFEEKKASYGLSDVAVPVAQLALEDPASLEALVGRADVVLDCVGPFALYGPPVVRACLAAGTDFCDITGEPEYVDAVASIVEGHESSAASATPIRIMHCCGFDSIPADLGVYYTLSQMNTRDREQVVALESFVRARGGPSNGTVTSALRAISRFSLHDVVQQLDAWYPTGSLVTRSLMGPAAFRPHYNSRGASFVLPMPCIDPLIVRRSLKSRSPPVSAAYGQFIAMRGFFDWLKALCFFPVIVFAIFLAKFSFGLKLLTSLGPKQRSGPSAEKRAKSKFSTTVVATSASGATLCACRVSGGDPGYTETAKMVAECAMVLARLRHSKKDNAKFATGVVTTAQLGELIVPALSGAGIVFEKLK